MPDLYNIKEELEWLDRYCDERWAEILWLERKPFAVCCITATGWPCPLQGFDTYDEADDALGAFWHKYPQAWLEIGEWDQEAKDYTLDPTVNSFLLLRSMIHEGD